MVRTAAAGADSQPGPGHTARSRALAPVTGALLGRAEEHARRVRDEAERAAEATLAEAHRQATLIEAESLAAGRAEAESLAAAERAQARRQARSVVLRARAEAYGELRRLVLEGVRSLRTEPCYPRLLDRLTELARVMARTEIEARRAGGTEPPSAGSPAPVKPALGEPAPGKPALDVEALEAGALDEPALDEPDGGGVVATAPGLRIDLSADALADRAVELLGAEVMRLWEPRSHG